MRRLICLLAVSCVCVMVAAEEPQREQPAAAKLDKLAEGARGLSGQVTGRVISRDHEQGSLVLQVVRLDNVWKANKATEPKSIVGQTLRVEKVFGKFLDVLLTLQPGDGVKVEVKHVSGDQLVFLGEMLRKVELPTAESSESKPAAEKPDAPAEAKPGQTAAGDELPGMAGFRGILTGAVVSTDVERGTLIFRMEGVKRVWKQNKAPAPERSKDREIHVEGISGKFLDVLLTLKPGDKIEVEAFQVRGATLKFPGEWLKKLDPADGDQP